MMVAVSHPTDPSTDPAAPASAPSRPEPALQDDGRAGTGEEPHESEQAQRAERIGPEDPDHPGQGGSHRPVPGTGLLLKAGVPVIVAMVLFIAAATIPVSTVIESPGPTWNVLGEAGDGSDPQQSTPIISVTGAQTYDTPGTLRMTTVSVRGCPGHEVTTLDVIRAWFDDSSTIIDKDSVCPDSQTEEEIDQVNQAQMTGSQDAAVIAALIQTGLADSMILTVQEIVPEQTSTELHSGDVLTSLTPDGGPTTTITDFEQLRELMGTIAAGTPVSLGVLRDGQEATAQLTTLPPEPDGSGSLLGVHLQLSVDSEVEASFGLTNVGGPSAGSMFALGIVDELTPGDMTGGKDIAGTGTITASGDIGPIGGIAQKMEGASLAGSAYFLAPVDNCASVVGHVPEGMQVVPVATLDEAVKAVEAIAADQGSSLPECASLVDPAP